MTCKRFIAALLALVMILGWLPVTTMVTAADGFDWVDADQLTGYADSTCLGSSPSKFVDGSTDTQWHTNYAGDEYNADDPLVEASGSTLTGNNNLYIVLAQPMDVGKLSFDLIDRPNAQIQSMNVYVSSEVYTKETDAQMEWGSVVARGNWEYTGPEHRELELDSVQTNVRSIRLEVKEVTGSAPYNIRCTEIGVYAKVSEAPAVEYEFANIDSSKLTAYADSTCLGSSPANMVDGDLSTQWHTNYAGEDSDSGDPFVEGSGGNLTANNNIYIVLDEAMPVNQLSLYTNDNPNAQITAVKVYVSSEEYTKGASLDWGEAVGSSDWSLISGPAGRDLALDEVQYGVKSIRIEVTRVNGNTNIRCSEVYVSVGTAKDTPETPEVEYAYLTPDQMTGYADSTFGLSDTANALDDDHATNWHTNYNEPDGGSSDDPYVQGVGGSLTGNNNFYIVLKEAMSVDKLAFYLDERNANIKSLNVYVSDKDYGETKDIEWDDIVASGDWALSGGRTETLAFPEPEMNVKTIRLEITEVHGNTNIRGIDFYVSAGKVAADEPETPDEPVEYEFANIDSSKLTAYADSTCLGSSPANMVDGDLSTQWHTNYAGEDSDSGDPFVEGSGGNLTANNNIYIVLDEAMPVNQLSLYTNDNPNAQITAVKVYVSSEEYTKGASLDWGEAVGSSDWSLISGPAGRDLALDEVQYGVKSIRIEVIRVNGNTNIRCSEVYVSVGTVKGNTEAPTEPVIPEEPVEYEFANIDSSKLTAFADSTCLGSDPMNMVDGNLNTQWHTNYAGEDSDSGDPFVKGDGNGNLSADNNIYIVLDEAMPVDKLSLHTNDNPNGQMLGVNVYVSSEEYTKGAALDWGNVVGSGDWELIAGPAGRDVMLNEIQYNVKSIRIEVVKVRDLNGGNNVRCSEVYVSVGTVKGNTEAPTEPVIPEDPVIPEEPVEYEFAYIDSAKLTAYADSAITPCPASNAVDGDKSTQWHTNYEDEAKSDDPFVQGDGSGNLTGNNNFYIVLDEPMPVDKLSLYTNNNPNGQMRSVNVYVSSEEYTKGADLDWGSVVGATPNGGWPLSDQAIEREIVLNEVQHNVKSIRVEVTQVYGNNNIRLFEAGVSVGTPKEIVYEYDFLTPDQMTGYADSTFGLSDTANALDDDHTTNWHTNYNEPDGGSSDDPYVEGVGGSLTGNNNFYIVLKEKMPVDKLAFYLDERNANIKSLNVYVSDKDYGETQDIEWGDIVASGDWALSGGRTETLAFPEPEMNVKTIRLEITEVHGNTNIRGIDFYVSAGKVAEDEPETPDVPDEPDVPGEKPMFTLGVLGDLHIDSGIERWDPPIRSSVTTTVNAWAEEENVDLIAFPGDVISSHLGSYWGANGAQKKATFDNVKAAFMDAVYTATDSGRAVFVGGNHDFRVGMLDFNSADYSEQMEPVLGDLIAAESVEDVSANAFYQTEFPAGTASGVEHVLAYHYNVDGIDFIMINPPYQMDENIYYYDLESLEWVANKMAAIGQDQTVFLVGHYPLQDGKDGHISTDAATHNALKNEILVNYPKAIYIYGHTHEQIIYDDTYERINTYMADGTNCDDRNAVTDGFITAFGGSMAYYGDSVSPSGNLGATTPDVVQALLIYIYKDRIVFQMKNYGERIPGAEEIAPYVVYRDVASEDDMSGLKEALKEALKAAEEANTVAQEALAAAEAANAKAEAAKLAAEEAAKTSAENTEAAEKAKVAAETAQAEAENAEAAAQAAVTAAEEAAKAAQNANVEAAKEALKAAEEAAKTAASADEAAASAQDAAEAQAAAQEAQAKAEAAQAAAEAAQAKAESAKAAAEAAESSAAQDKAAAEAAKKAAEDAVTAANIAVTEAEAAAQAAETAKTAADASNKEAAEEAVKAAQAAADAAEQAVVVAQYAADAADAQAKAQEAQAKAEAAQNAAEEAQKKAEQAAEEARIAAELESAKQQALMDIMIFNMGKNTDDLSAEAQAAYKEAIATATADVIAAQDQAAVQEILDTMEQTVEEIFDQTCPAEEFADVEADGWYHEAVDYMVENGYMNGVSETLFDVNGSVTRGQLVTILYRVAGEPSVEGLDNPFEDVEDGTWYTNAVIWAANEGVVKGVSETAFAPANEITREQIVTILYRYDGEQKVDEDALADYSDADSVSTYAADAMNWAITNGIVNGMTETTLAPAATATRVQISAILMRYLKA